MAGGFMLNGTGKYGVMYKISQNGGFIEGSLEVKLPTIWTDEKQSRAEAE